MNIPCITAGVFGTVAFVVHGFGFGRTAAMPSELPPARARYLLYHYAIAVVLFAMTATAFGKGFGSFPHEAVWAMGAIAAGISAASVVAAIRAHLGATYLPLSYLMAAMALAVGTDLL